MEPKDAITSNDDGEVKEEEVSHIVYGLMRFKNANCKMFERGEACFCATDFVASKLGDSFAEAPKVSMIDVYNDTNKITPCIFVLVSGADPTEAITAAGKE